MKNKEITIYELIGLIKDGKAPKKIKYYEATYELDDNNNYYLKGRYEIEYSMFYKLAKGYMFLNDTVEILSEENDEWKDICELLDDSRYNFSDRQNGMTQEDRRLLDSNFKTLGEIINQLIKNQKYLREKLDSKNER